MFLIWTRPFLAYSSGLLQFSALSVPYDRINTVTVMSTRRHTPDSFLFSRGHFQWHPNDTFGDSRTFVTQNIPLRHVILEKITLDGGSFSLNPTTGQLVVVARES